MSCYLNLSRMVYGLKIVELLEKDGIKTNSYVERLINEILDENLDVLNPPLYFCFFIN